MYPRALIDLGVVLQEEICGLAAQRPSASVHFDEDALTRALFGGLDDRFEQ